MSNIGFFDLGKAMIHPRQSLLGLGALTRRIAMMSGWFQLTLNYLASQLASNQFYIASSPCIIFVASISPKLFCQFRYQQPANSGPVATHLANLCQRNLQIYVAGVLIYCYCNVILMEQHYFFYRLCEFSNLLRAD